MLAAKRHVAGSVRLCSRNTLRILFILSTQNNKPWTPDADKICSLIGAPGLDPPFSQICCHTGLWTR